MIRNYGSIDVLNGNQAAADDLVSLSVDAEWERKRRLDKRRGRQLRHFYPPGTINQGINEASQTSAEILLSTSPEGGLCNSTYVIEPVAFIQNLATSIMGISLGQFIYNRILTRLINEFRPNHNSTTAYPTTTTVFPPLPSNTTDSCGHNSSNFTSPDLPTKAGLLLLSVFNSEQLGQLPFSPYLSIENNLSTSNYQWKAPFGDWTPSPSEMDEIRKEAQSQTAHLYFISALFSGIPVIIMTNLLGVNCSTLGRKTLMLIYLAAMSIKFTLILLQCVYPDWPDWLFYLGAFTEGISGSSGVFYLSLYCYIADLTSARSRSYRITFLNSLNSIASLCVTFACGYVIEWYGYFYLFLVALVFMVTSLLYTFFFIPEPLIELRDKSLMDRLKLCSLKRTINCFTAYFSRERDKNRRETTESDVNENDALLPTDSSPELPKQTFVLLLIVFANFIYVFATNGIGSVFTLFIMNAPFCFSPVDISNFSLFATVISLIVSLFISKFIQINDLIICILSTLSYFASVFCYIFGQDSFFVYLGSVISSPAGLEYGYVRSIVSKSVEKDQVGDALSLILIIDTFIGVVASVLSQVLYAHLVSTNNGVSILFSFCNGFVLISIVCHIINYCLYIPVKEETAVSGVMENEPNQQPSTMSRYLSVSDDNLAHYTNDDNAIRAAKRNYLNDKVDESILNPFHKSLALSSTQLI